jgi:hypothetical protein
MYVLCLTAVPLFVVGGDAPRASSTTSGNSRGQGKYRGAGSSAGDHGRAVKSRKDRDPN